MPLQYNTFKINLAAQSLIDTYTFVDPPRVIRNPFVQFLDLFSTELLYTCQLFLRYKREIFNLRVPGFSKTTRSFPKIPEKSPKSSEEVRSLPKTSKVFRSLRTRINASSLPVFFTSKIRDREEGIVIYSFFTWFPFLTWV